MTMASGAMPAMPGERLRAVAGQRDVVAVELQRPAQGLAHGAVVVDDEHTRAGAVVVGSHALKPATGT